MYDIHSVSAELGLSPDELAEIVTVFCTELTDMLTAMEASASQADYVMLAQLCHSLKGTAANLRVKELSSLAGELECRAKQQEKDAVSDLLPRLRQTAAECIAAIEAALAHNS